jgi:hypothetical protein
MAGSWEGLLTLGNAVVVSGAIVCELGLIVALPNVVGDPPDVEEVLFACTVGDVDGGGCL